MKKLLALLLALVMVFSLVACGEKTPDQTQAPAETNAPAAPEQTDAPEAPAEAIEVVYYCSVGAYLAKLQEEVNKWNEGEGKEAGVYLRIESNINTYSQDLEALMLAGTHFDLIDAGTGNDHWKLQGWVQDLWAIDNAELKEIISGYEQYFVAGINTDPGPDGEPILGALPLEVVPLKMAVNTDLFEQAGCELPTTWPEVVEAAKKITALGDGIYGYGGTTWSAYYTRLHMLTSANSTPVYWNPNTETYSFAQYEEIMKAIKEMFDAGCIMGLDDLAIDPIRAEFANGKVGMFPAPSYDYAVYTTQFPAQCNWTVIDMPKVTGGGDYKGLYMDRVGCAIDAVSYEAADDAKKEAIVKAFCFLNSDELNASIYSIGGMIPYKPEVIANTELQDGIQEQWALFADIENYMSQFQEPSISSYLEGDKIHDVFNAFVHGAITWEEAVTDLETRYNAAWAAAKADPDVNVSNYVYSYDHP